REHVPQASLDPSVPRHHAVAEILLVGEPEVGRAVRHEAVELDERAGIEQRVEALARRHLPLLVLDLDALGAAAELGLGALLLEQLELLTHSHEQNLGSREQDGYN